MIKSILFALITLLAFTGCIKQLKEDNQMGYPILSKEIGSEVTVFLKRNELGMAANLPLSPSSSGINGAGATLNGKLLKVNENGILISLYNSDHSAWVPLHSILHITFNEDLS